MGDDDERREIEIVRYALCGATDAGTRDIERRIAAGDAGIAREVAVLRLTADVIRGDARGGPSPGALARLDGLVRSHDPLPPRSAWLQAVPLAAPAGVRGPVPRDGVLHCETPEFRLLVSLVTSTVDDGHGVTGHVVDDAEQPIGGVDIAWIVDGLELGRTCTDELGEFSFDAAPGREYVLRVEGSHGPRFVQLPRDDDA